MAASKTVASPAAVLVLLPLVMLMRPPTALAARHLPVTTSHRSLISLIPPSTHFPRVISHPPPPPPAHSATNDDEFSVLRKVPRGPGHSPNDPSPPPPPRSATTTAKLSLLPDTEQAARHLTVTTSHLSLGPLRLPPPPPATSAADGDEFSVLRKDPRGPGHSPNDPSPPPPLLLVTKQVAAASSSEHHPASWCYPPILRDPIDASEPTAAADDDESSVLRKVPRGPGHSPNDPSPPPPLLQVTKQEAAAGSSEHPTSWCWIPPAQDPIDASEPAVAGKQE